MTRTARSGSQLGQHHRELRPCSDRYRISRELLSTEAGGQPGRHGGAQFSLLANLPVRDGDVAACVNGRRMTSCARALLVTLMHVAVFCCYLQQAEASLHSSPARVFPR